MTPVALPLMAQARQLLARTEPASPGCCAWCRCPLRRPGPDDDRTARRRYCSSTCQALAGRVRSEAKAGETSTSVVLLAVALGGVKVSGGTVQTTGLPEDLADVIQRHRCQIAEAVERAWRIFDDAGLAAIEPNGWVACTRCGWPQFFGNRPALRKALGRRCRLTPKCAGVLGIVLDPRRRVAA